MAKLKLVLLFLIFISSAEAATSRYFEQRYFPLTVEFGFRYLHPSFTPISNVVIRNAATSNDTGPVYGNVGQTYPDVFAQTIRADMMLSESSKTIVSLNTFLPLNSLTQMDSGNTFLPEYALYRTENQRPRLSMMAETNLSELWRVGLGLDLGFGVTSDATVFLQSGTNKYSSQRISATAKAKVIPMASVEYDRYRLLVKGENKVNFTLNASAGASVFPPLSASFDTTFRSSSALFFDPWTFDLSHTYSLESIGLSLWNLDLGIAYQMWSRYEARAAVIRDASSTFSNGLSPVFETSDLFVPRMAVGQTYQYFSWDIGYQFKDSIFKSTPSSTGNYLDPPRHDLTLGSIFQLSSGWELGVNLQVSRLVEQNVVKLNSGEIGASPNGYQASGWLYGGNLSLTVPFEAKKI